jgi:hypothetical protein
MLDMTSPPARFLKYELGVARQFGLADIGRQGLVSGWATPEDSHVWNDGPEAMLAVITEMPAGPVVLTVEGGPYINARQPVQEVTLYANGWRLGFWRFRENGPVIMEAVVQPEFFLPRPEGALLNLVWHLPSAVKPCDLGLSADGRELGFVFRSLLVKSDLGSAAALSQASGRGN